MIMVVIVSCVCFTLAFLVISKLKSKISSLQKVTHIPVSSCAALLELHPSSPSSYYWIRSSNGSAVHVHCDMTLSCGNITGGWTRVVNLDMRDINAQCPDNLTECMDSSIRTCETPSYSTCSQITYFTENINFVEVCGKIN